MNKPILRKSSDRIAGVSEEYGVLLRESTLVQSIRNQLLVTRMYEIVVKMSWNMAHPGRPGGLRVLALACYW
jgi:hypothetical protein